MVIIQLLWIPVQEFLKKLNINLSYDPVTPLIGILFKRSETYVHMRSYTGTFIVTLFVILPNWKQLKCPSGDEWINRLWYAHIMEYY